MKDSKHPIQLIVYRLINMEELKEFLERRPVGIFITALIIVNAVTIGLETSDKILNFIGFWLESIDRYILIIFTLEISLKLVSYRHQFFTKAWNLFDLIIIGMAWLPITGPLHILRTLRILRTIRLVKTIPKLRMIIESLIRSIPSIGWIIVLLFMIFYIFAVIGTDMYSDDFPEYFGDLGKSFFTLFQVMTLESWSSGIARPMMDKMPYSYVFFVPFILLATYTTLNVFIAVVVNTMNEINREANKSENERLEHLRETEHSEVMLHFRSLSRKIDKLEKKLQEKANT